MLADLKYALRQCAKQPGFTLFVVLTLGLGIGANTAIFSVVDAVLLSELPVKRPNELVFLTDPNSYGTDRGMDAPDRRLITYQEFRFLEDHNPVFSGVAAASGQPSRVPVTIAGEQGGGRDTQAQVSLVSGNYFRVLGVAPILGRAFAADADHVRNGRPIAVVSYGYWRQRLGGDPGILGQTIHIQGAPFTIIGVAPPGFTGDTVGSTVSLWVPLGMQPEVIPGEDDLSENDPMDKVMWLQAIGRLKTGISLNQAQAAINLSFGQYIRDQAPRVPVQAQRDFLSQHLTLVPGSHGASTLRQSSTKPLVILMTLVALLLLITCANLVNLLLARATTRQREIAIRTALGARPRRILRQMLVESLLLAAVGGGAALLLACWGDAMLIHTAKLQLDLRLDTRILLFTLATCVAVGVVIGVLPAARAMRVNPNATLKTGTSGHGPGGGFSASRALVVAQVAFSLLLLITAGLFIKSFQNLAEAGLGYEGDHLIIFGLNPARSNYQPTAITPLYHELLERIGALPGVRGVTLSNDGLFSGTESGLKVAAEGREKSGAAFDEVGPHYFATVGIPVLLGRDLTPQDGGSGQRYGLINQTMAHQLFGGSNPLGRRIRALNFPVDFIVVGVAADAKYNNVREKTPPRFYVPFFNPMFPTSNAYFEVRVVGQPDQAIAGIRQTLAQMAPNLPPVDPVTVTERVDASLSLDQMLAKLSGLFGGLAAILVSIGIYSLLSYTVSRRSREFGIRMALGAQQGDVLRMILRECLLLVAVGVAIGIPATIAAGRFLTSLLYDLSPVNPAVLAIVAALMFAVALAAGYIPASRATRVDPAVALRDE